MAALIPAAVGLAGSVISSKATKSAANTAAQAAQFHPYNTSNLFGSTNFINQGNQSQIDQTMAPWLQQLTQSLQGQAQTAATNPFGSYATNLQNIGLGDIGGAYSAAQNYGGLSPDFINQITGGYGNVLNGSPVYNTPGMDLSGLVGQASGNPFSQEMISTGRNLLNQNYGDVAAQQLGLMRQQAQPYEDQATNSLFQRLYGQGRLGSTGGGRDITAFAQGLSQADTGRQLSAMNFAQQLRSQDQGIGANLFNSGNSAYLQGLGLAGNIGSNINSLGLNRDQYLTQAGLAGNQQYLSALQGLQNFGLNTDALNYSRANDRIARASDLFGFGNAIGTSNTQNLSNYLGLLSGIAGEQNQSAQLGLAAGGQQASAGANAGRFQMSAAGSPLGGFFQGLGSAVLGSDSGQAALSGLWDRMVGTGSLNEVQLPSNAVKIGGY